MWANGIEICILLGHTHMGNASSAGLPYVAGEEDGDWARSTSQGHWHLHSGTKKVGETSLYSISRL